MYWGGRRVGSPSRLKSGRLNHGRWGTGVGRMATASTIADRLRTVRVRAPGGKKLAAAVALAPLPAVKPPPRRRRRPTRPGTDASKDHRDAHSRGNDLPWVLRAGAPLEPHA